MKSVGEETMLIIRTYKCNSKYSDLRSFVDVNHSSKIVNTIDLSSKTLGDLVLLKDILTKFGFKHILL